MCPFETFGDEIFSKADAVWLKKFAKFGVELLASKFTGLFSPEFSIFKPKLGLWVCSSKFGKFSLCFLGFGSEIFGWGADSTLFATSSSSRQLLLLHFKLTSKLSNLISITSPILANRTVKVLLKMLPKYFNWELAELMSFWSSWRSMSDLLLDFSGSGSDFFELLVLVFCSFLKSFRTSSILL